MDGYAGRVAVYHRETSSSPASLHLSPPSVSQAFSEQFPLPFHSQIMPNPRSVSQAQQRASPATRKTSATVQSQRRFCGFDDEDLEVDDLDDDRFLQGYRRKRLTEMQQAAQVVRYRSVVPISGSDYVREVSQAGQDVWVVVFLYKEGFKLWC